MSQINTGQPDINVRRTRSAVDDADRLGRTERLIAPGVAPVPPASEGATLAQQLENTLGIAAQATASVIDTQTKVKAFDERQARAQAHLDQGQASLNARTDLSGDIERIASTEWEFFAELEQAGLSVKDHAEVLIGQRAEGLSDAYREAYASIAQPQLVAALTKRRAQLEQENRGAILSTLSDALAATDTSSHPVIEIRSILKTMGEVDPSLSEEERMAALLPIAEEAARRGQVGFVEAIQTVLGDRFMLEQQRVGRIARDEIVRQEIESEQLLTQALVTSVVDGTPAEVINSRLEAMREDIGPDNAARVANMLAGREQDRHLNDRRLQVGLGIWEDGDPALTAQSLIQDMARDPSDPRYIRAEQGLPLVRQLTTQLKVDLTRTLVVRQISGEGGAPLPASADSAIDLELASIGLIDAVTGNNGQAIVRGVNDEPAFALASDKLGRVTNQMREVLAASMQGDAPQVQSAGRAVVALHQQNPLLAEQVMGRMEPLAKLRARFMISRLSVNESPWLEPELMNIRPLDIEDETMNEVLWGGAEGGDRNNRAIGAIRALVEEAGFEDTFRLGFGTYFGSMSPLHVDRYEAILEDEYRIARSIVPDEQSAIRQAQGWAKTRFLAEHPPIVWDGEIMLTESQIPTSPNFQRLVIGELRSFEVEFQQGGMARTGNPFGDDEIEDLLDNHRPVWDQANQAFMFVDDSGAPYRWNPPNTVGGEVLLINPYKNTDIQSIEAQGAEWENAARRNAQPREDEIAFPDLDDHARNHGPLN